MNEYTVFDGKKVSVPSDLVSKYEAIFFPVHNYTVEYMVLNEGADQTSSIDTIEKAIVKGFEYEIYFATHTSEEVTKAIKSGEIQ